MSQPSFATAAPPLGRRYDVCGRQLLLHRSGAGGPAVVFLPGAGLIGLDYLNIHDEISRRTTCVLYDRAGTGWSDEIALPRSAAEVVDELHDLLHAAQVPPPYVLVGHSLGGAYARRYAQRYPDEVAGLVMLDPAHEGYASLPKQTLLDQVKMGVAALPALIDIKRFYRPMFEQMLARWPDALRQRLIDYHLRSWRKSLHEAKNLQTEVLDEVRLGGIDPFQAAFTPEPDLRALNTRKQVFYEDFARLAPRGENRPVEDAGHSTLHTDRPHAVIKAICDVLDQADRTLVPAAVREAVVQ